MAALVESRPEREKESEEQSGAFEQRFDEYPSEYLEKVGGTDVEDAACQPRTSKPLTERRMPALSCRQHKRVYCQQCFEIPTPTHHCQALIVICQECGLHHFVIANACQSENKAQQMPVANGTVVASQ